MKKALGLTVFMAAAQTSLYAMQASSFSPTMPEFRHTTFTDFNGRFETREFSPAKFTPQTTDFSIDFSASADRNASFSSSNLTAAEIQRRQNDTPSGFDENPTRQELSESNDRFSNMRMEFHDPAQQHLNFNAPPSRSVQH